jgi:PiT family inorganic phosphate transporter
VHIGAFSLLSFSYGANDSQKMLAVIAIAAGTAQGSVPAIAWQVAVGTALFALGTLLGVSRMSRTVSRGILPARPLDTVSAEVSTAAAMLISTTVGSPTGLAQTLAGGLIGSGASQGTRRVRWREVSRIITAWIVTLPCSFLLTSGVGLAGNLV